MATAFEVFAPAVESEPAVLETANCLAEKTFQETGFDVKTGQILDEARFQTWKQQNAQPSSAEKPAVTYASLFEVFRKARNAIESWVDEDKNRSLILHADFDEITTQPPVQAILQEYATYGREMREKLIHHLELMVENRRKYYKATG
jgi:hypothetical protein